MGLTPLLLLLLLWQLFGSTESLTFPPPSSWWQAANDLFLSGELTQAMSRTLMTFILGVSVAIVVGVAIGWLTGSSRRLARAVNPILELFRTTPTPALVPIATVLFGVSISSSIVIMLISVVWPVLLNTVSSRQLIPAVRIEASEILGLNKFDRMRKVIFPSLLPDIMTGVRTTVSLGFIVALLIDIIGSGAGLGRLLVVSQQQFDSASVWAILVIIGFFGLIVNGAVIYLDTLVKHGRN